MRIGSRARNDLLILNAIEAAVAARLNRAGNLSHGVIDIVLDLPLGKSEDSSSADEAEDVKKVSLADFRPRHGRLAVAGASNYCCAQRSGVVVYLRKSLSFLLLFVEGKLVLPVLVLLRTPGGGSRRGVGLTFKPALRGASAEQVPCMVPCSIRLHRACGTPSIFATTRNAGQSGSRPALRGKIPFAEGLRGAYAP